MKMNMAAVGMESSVKRAKRASLTEASWFELSR